MNNTTSVISASLLIAPYQLNIFFGSFLWIMGNFGCIGNMLVYRSRAFRKQSYAVYLFSVAVADCHYFNFVLLTRILQNGFRIPVMNRYLVICKLRQFSTFWGNIVSFSLFSFAIIDRLLSVQRSNTYRQWSNRVSVAYKMIILIPLFWLLLIGHRLILYRIKNGVCGPPDGFYNDYDNYFQVIFSSLSSTVVMAILAYLLIKSVRDIANRRVVPMNSISANISQKNSMLKDMDAQLTKMLVTESIIAVITYFPYAVQLTYSNITQTWYKTPLQIAWENVFIELIHLLNYVFFATSFYVSLISNVGFRRKIKQLLKINKHIQSDGQTITFRRDATMIQ
ncbi:unnamed protein product [Adineta steineri]|uniref:G-protein coupled receptors family 1 profile domain-containing protein n=1 Tax=Adineta steineri TaxID=433720 RepID=A0A815QXI4_9BILA|nr:unnamed protein product [Adineta steineri]CAF1469178.1 unnamed protein product [Adineta steineri]CAF1469671.1 unnamed protein product [Adineta steineri]